MKDIDVKIKEDRPKIQDCYSLSVGVNPFKRTEKEHNVKISHYVYLLQVLTPWDERSLYIGKHSGQIEDMGTTYFSSGAISKYYRENPKDVKVTILYETETSQEAMEVERECHIVLDVSRNKKYFNKIISNGIDYVSGKGKHRKIECDICGKEVVYYRINRHKETHKNNFIKIRNTITNEIHILTELEYFKNFYGNKDFTKCRKKRLCSKTRGIKESTMINRFENEKSKDIDTIKRLIEQGIITEEYVYETINICPTNKDPFKMILDTHLYKNNKIENDFIKSKYVIGELYTNEQIKIKFKEYVDFKNECNIESKKEKFGINSYKRLVKYLFETKIKRVWNKDRTKLNTLLHIENII